MKLKKLLAAVTAAALAVSTMAVSSFTASADGEVTFASTNDIAAKSVVIDYSLSTDKQNDWEYKYNSVDVIVKTWNNTASAGDWIQYGVGGSEQAQYYGSGKFTSYEGTALNSSITADLTEYDTLNELAILYKNDETVYAFEIKSVKAYSEANGAGDIVWQYPASSEEPGEVEINVTPKEKSIAVDETFDITVEVTATTNLGDGGVVEGTTTYEFDDTVVDVTDNEDGTYTVKGVAAGETEMTFTWEPTEASGVTLEHPVTDVCTVTVTAKDDGGDAEIPEGKKITLAENSWGEGGPDNTNWQGMDSVAIEGITNWTTTATEAMEKLDSLEFSFPVNGAISNGQVFDVSKLSFQGVLQTSDGCWKTFDGSVADGKVTISIPDVDSALADYTGTVNIAVVVNTAYSNSANEIDVYIGAVTVKTDSDEPAPPVDPDGEVLFSGNAAANTSVSGSKVSKYKDDAVITVKYMPAATEAEFIEAAQITAEEMEYPANTGTIAGQLDADPWWCQPAESAYWSVASSEAFGNEQTFTITVADYLASISRTELPYELVFCPWNGTKITKVTIKGELKSSEPEPPKPDDPKPDNPKPEDPKPDNTVTTPSERVTYSVVVPFGYTPATDEEITNAVSSTAEGDTASVNLTSGTRVEKSVLDTIAGKDINVEFKLKGGVKWIINGKNVEKAKKVDLGVRLRSKNIPAEKISAVAGDNKTVQFSLRHNGDLGFTGALIIPFSASYNGKFANLYYYNTAKDELEFIGSSKISAGQASFVFKHASDYVVVIDDEAYGEDVSSAAGVYETSEMTAAPYAAVAVIAVLGAVAVVIKKRFAK